MATRVMVGSTNEACTDLIVLALTQMSMSAVRTNINVTIFASMVLAHTPVSVMPAIGWMKMGEAVMVKDNDIDIHFCAFMILLLITVDIDECREGSHSCDQHCRNTLGSYTCSCNLGYLLDANGHTCNGECKSTV